MQETTLGNRWQKSRALRRARARAEAGRAAEGEAISSLPVKKLTFVPTGNGKPSRALREISDAKFKWSPRPSPS